MRLLRSAVAITFIAVLLCAGPLALRARAEGRSYTRPIQEFVSAQDQFGIIIWTDPFRNLFLFMDYTGILNGQGLALGTSFDGTIEERPLADGRAAVHVLLRTKNAIAWVTTGLDPFGPILFGNWYTDVLQNGVDPAVGDCVLTVDFINSEPGAPMPPMSIMWDAGPGQTYLGSHFVAWAKGTLRAAFGVPDGTPGAMQSDQLGLDWVPSNPHSHFSFDNCPVEHIDLRATGG